jgi:hypothetical protein
MVAQALDIDAPQLPPQVVERRSTPLLQAHPQDLIIGSPSRGVMTRSQKHASFIEHHSFVSCIEPTSIDEALKDSDWVNAMHEELNNFTYNEIWTLEDPRYPNHVYRLSKALYGLKQDPRAWYERLQDFLIEKGFKIGMVDTTLFTKNLNGDIFICQV